jgi:cation:H+ antiporter
MLLAILFLLIGTAVLAVGAESAVRGTARFAVAAGISAFALGALLFGIDFEGTATALIAAGRGQTALAAGEAYGSVIFLLTGAFGAALLFARKPVESPSVAMVVAPALPIAAGALALYDRTVTRPEGVLLVLVYAGYVAAVVAEGRAVKRRADELEREARELGGGRMKAGLIAAAGFAGLLVGAWLLVQGGVRILERTGLAAGFVGAAIVGTLASLDEVLLEILPIRMGHPELATGNLFGTVAAFTSAVPGLAALVRPLQLDGAAAVAFLAAAALYALVATWFLLRERAGWVLGVIVLVAYAAWLVYAASL